MDNNTLNGFEALFEDLNPLVGKQSGNTQVDDDVDDNITDEELDALTKQTQPAKPVNKPKTEPEEDEDDDDSEEEDDEPVEPKRKPGRPKKEDTEPANDDDDDDNDPTIVTAFFDSLADKLGWGNVPDDSKPSTPEDLIAYFQEVIEENSVPQYASEETAALDEFVRNGGNLRDFYSIGGAMDLDTIELEDNENAQKQVVTEYLRKKGVSAAQINKKLQKYEDAGILEDEAADALEELKQINAEEKEELLKTQKQYAEQVKAQQQQFTKGVVGEIKGLSQIYGVNVSLKDKDALLKYLFSYDENGVSQYQKDYAKSYKNLVMSAYLTMKGEDVFNQAKVAGKKDAFATFKKQLKANNTIPSKTKKPAVEDDDSSDIWGSLVNRIRQV